MYLHTTVNALLMSEHLYHVRTPINIEFYVGNLFILCIQGLYSALFTNKRALMRCLTNKILIFTKKCSLKSKLFM